MRNTKIGLNLATPQRSLYHRWCRRMQNLMAKDPKKFRLETGPIHPLKGDSYSIKHEVLLARLGSPGDEGSKETMRVHGLTGYMSNLYVVEYPARGETLLLDGGVNSDFLRVDHLVQSISKNWTSKPPKPKLTMALSSHCHIDHIGSLERHLENGTFCCTTANWEQYYKPGAYGSIQRFNDGALCLLVASRLQRGVEWPWHQKRLPTHFTTTQPPPSMDEPSPTGREYALLNKRQLRDCAHVPEFPDWVTLHAPGHTAHMSIMYHPESRILYAADLTIFHRSFITPTPIEHPTAHNHTLHRLRQLKVDFLLLAHGGIINIQDRYGPDGWNDVLDLIVDHFKESTDGKVKASSLWGKFVTTVIHKGLLGWSNDTTSLSRDQFPRNSLPGGYDPPAPVFHLKS